MFEAFLSIIFIIFLVLFLVILSLIFIFLDLFLCFFYNFFQNKTLLKYKIKYYFFLFKWFLIGKNHCDVPPVFKKFFYIIHKGLWILIALSLSFSTYNLLIFLNP